MKYLVLALFLLTAVAAPTSAEAIPAFARTYGVPCSTCHIAITRRNEFGDAFRKAGYRWPGEAASDHRARSTPDVEMKGIGLVSGALPGWLPLSLSASLSGAYTNDAAVEDPVVLGSPSFNLLFGGAFSDHLSFFGTWAGKGSPNELYLHAGRLFGRKELNLRVGLFEQTTTLAKNNEALLTKFVVGTGSINGHVVATGRIGAELNGQLFDRTFYAVGAVQNGGVGSNVDAYYSVSQKIGGITLDGEEPDIDLDEPSVLDDIILTVSHFGYIGVVEDDAGTDLTLVRRLGVEARFELYRFAFWTGAMVGLDQDVPQNIPAPSITCYGEATYAFLPWLVGMYAYQYQDAASFEREVQRHDFGAVLILPENVRARAKFGFTDDGERNEVAELQLLMGI